MVVLDGHSIDDILSAFAYKPSHQSSLVDNQSEPSSPPPPPTTPAPPPPDASSLTRPARGRGRGLGRGRGRGRSNRGGSTRRCDEDSESKQQWEEGPDTPPPLPQTLRRLAKLRRKILTSPTLTSSSPVAPSSSSFIRSKVGGKSVVISRFFSLPPKESSDVLTDSIRKPKARCSRSRCRDDEETRKRKRNCVDEDLNEDGEELKKRRARKQPTPQLSSAEKKSDAYRRVPIDSTWEPPASCHHLLQELHAFDPWRVLVICMLLNITTGKQVGKVLPSLFLLCPDAQTTTMVSEQEIQKVVQSLGLQKKRARMIKQFSCEYLQNDWTHVTQLHGIGKYAADAYAIFCVGKPDQVVPQDHKLLDYWKFVRADG